MRGGVIALGAGFWLLCQVFSGNMLGRLGLVGAAATAREAEAATDTGARTVPAARDASPGGGASLAGGRTAT